MAIEEVMPLEVESATASGRIDESQTWLVRDSPRLRPRVTGESSDADLVVAARAGDPYAAALIWRRYAGHIRTRVRRWIGLQDVEDIVQEVFSRLFEHLTRLREAGALRGFLIGIALRVARTELRCRRRLLVKLTPTGDLPDLGDNFGDPGPDREALWRFEAILGALRAPSRRVFLLRYVDKLELLEVAAAMEISLPTVKRHLARAVGHVAARLESEPALTNYVERLDLKTSLQAARRSRRRLEPAVTTRATPSTG